MALYKKQSFRHADIAVWHVTESIDVMNEVFDKIDNNECLPDFGHKKRKLEWYASRILLNLLAGPGCIRYKQNGQPEFICFNQSSIHCSISHSGNWVVAAVSANFPIGIDLQVTTDKIHRIAPRFLSKKELEYFGSDTLSRCLFWSIKESVYKWYGLGGLTFSRDIIIEPFSIGKEGNALVKLIPCAQMLKVVYKLADHYLLSFCIND